MGVALPELLLGYEVSVEVCRCREDMLHVTTSRRKQAMSTSVSRRVQKRRDALRAAGLRPVQIWVSDTRRPGFAEECRRQSLMAAASDAADHDLATFMDAALADLIREDEA